MFKVGEPVKVIHDGSLGAVIAIEQLNGSAKYSVLVNSKVMVYFEDQLSPISYDVAEKLYPAKDINSLLTARLILNPTIASLYSLNAGRIDYIPYQFRPVLKIIKSDSPRLLIADGVGVGKTIEAGLILKELEARLDIKSVLVICPHPLITEKKWEDELRRFGEKFINLDGATLRYCLKETLYEDGIWPEQYQKCILPYSLFDEASVCGTADAGRKKIKNISLADLESFPKFDLVIIDEAHHIKNQNTFAYQAAQMFCDNAESIVLLTATPIQLRDRDLYVLLNLIRPDIVYDYESFLHMSEPNAFINEAVKYIRGNSNKWNKRAYSSLVEAGKTTWGLAMLTLNPVYKNALSVLQQDCITTEERVKLIGDVESLHTFASIINRTRRRDIGSFTLRKPETLKVHFTDNQYALYSKLLDTQAKILFMLHGNMNVRFMMTTLMRQAASCIHGLKPFLQSILTRHYYELEYSMIDYDGENDYSSIENLLEIPKIKQDVQEILAMADALSPVDYKLDALYSAILGKQKMVNNKVMVFSTFRHTLQYLYDNLSAKGIRVGIIHGGVPDEERVDLRERFMKDKSAPDSIDVLLFSEVGCEGLDYQFCDCMINYDLPWNPQAIEQRIGRIDRNGQKSESVSIINIITEGTIDCDIYERCLLRIGVFNSSIGDSEQILGDITKDIYDIAEKYILNPKERREKLQQLQDNKVRLLQEQQKIEDAMHSFFSLDLSSNAMQKELDDATNIHLSEDAINRLVETYLEKRLGGDSIYILGEGKSKTLRLNAENRVILLDDYYDLPKQNNPVYKRWEQYLSNAIPFERITFDGQFASEHPDVEFIMPTHPLVKQAVRCFEDDPVRCSLEVRSDELNEGVYPFIIYEWLYKGVKPNNKLQVVTQEGIDNSVFLKAIYNSRDCDINCQVDENAIEKIHFDLWQKSKQEYVVETEQIVGFKKQSLSSSYEAIKHTIENRLREETNPKIIKMKKAELQNKQNLFNSKMQDLDDEIKQSDIITKKLVVGVLKVKH